MRWSGLRFDKKCGASGIAANKKCSKATSPTSPTSGPLYPKPSGPKDYEGIMRSNSLANYARTKHRLRWDPNAEGGYNKRRAQAWNKAEAAYANSKEFKAYEAASEAKKKRDRPKTIALAAATIGATAGGIMGAAVLSRRLRRR